nr:MAG TPA: minor tail protein [Caudoviricetes sp.]
MPKQMKVLHAQYKFNTNVSRGGSEEDYVVVYLENNATDVMMQGYTQVPKEHIHTQGDLNNKDTAMDAFKKLDSAIRNRYFSHENGTSALKVNNNFTIDEHGTLGLNIIQLENRAAYNSIEHKDEKAIYVWTDDGVTGLTGGTPGDPSTGVAPLTKATISAHNTSPLAHQDIRNLITGLERTANNANTTAVGASDTVNRMRDEFATVKNKVTEITTSGIAKARLADRATTADRLTTARTINGVTFDGTSNITIDNVTNASVANRARGLQRPVHINGVEFDGTRDITIGLSSATTATKLTTPVLINGVSFDGSANITIPRVEQSNLATAATRLATARSINGIPFDGSTDITIPRVDQANSATTATRLARTVRINGIPFDGSSDINIPASAFAGVVAENANKLGGVAADQYALKRDVYTKQQVYTKEETYSRAEVDAKSGVIPGGNIYISD